MAQLEEGWPLGLQPLNNVRVIGQREYFGSASFSTLLSGSTTNSSTHSSSDLDTESTGSFFHDKSTTLGRLMGVPTTADLRLPTRRSLRLPTRRRVGRPTKRPNCRPKSWCFCLCPIITTDSTHSPKNNSKADYLAPSLGQYLEIERRASIGPDGLSLAQPESNSLFVNGLVAPPPRTSPLFVPRGRRRGEGEIVGGEGHGIPLLFSCMCG